ncbi:UDP-N-acetylglucosamine 1-carboxyvinyltransferase [candidate division NPL-UPA2 bacterium]|nr:UDP-N-acetylglucosamine 1-carboxyvinyltransferase [candidate division NPL-UPA2 bacterium]
MDKIIITGGEPLKGSVRISGAKNSALPIMAATLLAEGTSVISNIPHLRDVETMAAILRALGAKVRFSGDSRVSVNPGKLIQPLVPYDLVRTMRASICVLGPLLAKLGSVKVAHPGGCVIGPRPIDLHLKGLRKLGAKIEIEHGYIVAEAKARLKGSEIYLGGSFGSSVLGTANVMMAATLAKGRTVIEGAACEPEIVDLANFLNKMGAKVKGGGTHILQIQGVKKLEPAEHAIIPDRIEAGTYMVAGAITGGEVRLKGARFEHLQAVVDKLEEAGLIVNRTKEGIKVHLRAKLKAVDITTLPYPGFPTDMQAQMMVLMSISEGIGVIIERIYPDRFMHVSELLRMGANIMREGPRAIVKGGAKLSGAPVMASDLRASAALVLAGLVAEGETEISRVYHLDRGYERIEEKFSKLGARIRRVEE